LWKLVERGQGPTEVEPRFQGALVAELGGEVAWGWSWGSLHGHVLPDMNGSGGGNGGRGCDAGWCVGVGGGEAALDLEGQQRRGRLVRRELKIF